MAAGAPPARRGQPLLTAAARATAATEHFPPEASPCAAAPPPVPPHLLQLPQWVPLSVVKGGAAANMLVKGLETEFMRDTTVKTLVNVSAQKKGRRQLCLPSCRPPAGMWGTVGRRRAGRARCLANRWLAAPRPPRLSARDCTAEHRQGCVQGQGADHLGAAQGVPALQGDQGV